MSKFKAWISRFLLIIMLIVIGSMITKTFGEESEVTKFYYEKILFTPYNIVGIIMLVLACFGVWCGKKGGHKILNIVTKVSLAISIFSFISGFASWINLEVPDLRAETELAKIIHGCKVAGIVLISIIGIIVLLTCIYKIIEIIKAKKENSNIAKYSFSEQKVQIKDSKITQTQQEVPKALNQENSEKASTRKNVEEKKSENFQEHLIQDIFASEENMVKIANKICPLCGGRLKGHQNHEMNKWFMGCENYFTKQECKFTIDYSEYKNIENKYLGKNGKQI